MACLVLKILLYLANEFQNPSDLSTLLLCTKDNSKLLKVKIKRVNPVPTPLKLRLLCNMTAEWHEDFRPFSSREYQPLKADIPVTYASS
ncbi:MAG: hypothetical protein V7K41_19845 [Nostoc sp.]